MEMGGQRHAPAVLSPGKRPGTHCIGGWVGPRAGTEDLAPTGFRSPDRPARSGSLYRLRYPTVGDNFYLWLFKDTIGQAVQ